MSVLQCSDSKFDSVLLFGDTSFDNNKDAFSFDNAIGHNSSGRFNKPLFSS